MFSKMLILKHYVPYCLQSVILIMVETLIQMKKKEWMIVTMFLKL